MSSCNHVNFLKVIQWVSLFLTETQTYKNMGYSHKIDLLNPSIPTELKFIMSRIIRSGDLISKERWGELEGILSQLAHCSTGDSALLYARKQKGLGISSWVLLCPYTSRGKHTLCNKLHLHEKQVPLNKVHPLHITKQCCRSSTQLLEDTVLKICL